MSSAGMNEQILIGFFLLSYLYFCSDLYSLQWHFLLLPSKAFQLKGIFYKTLAIATSSDTNITFAAPSTHRKHKVQTLSLHVEGGMFVSPLNPGLFAKLGRPSV